MKKHFWITIVLCLSLVLNLSIPSCIHAQAESSHIEKIDGTFIQPWLYMMERGQYTTPPNWII